MKKVITIVIGVLLALVLILVLTPFWLDPNAYKDDIAAKVAEATGHKLTIAGDLRLSLFPWVRIEINEASLSKADGSREAPVARIGKAKVRVSLLSLLGNLDTALSTVTLSPLMLRLDELTTSGGLTLQGELSATVTADLEARRYQVANLAATLDAGGDLLGGIRVPVAVEGGFRLDLKNKTLQATGLVIRSSDLRLSGDAEAAEILGSPVATGSLDVAEVDLRAWLVRQGLAAPGTADPKTFQRVALNTRWQAGGGRIDLNGLTLTLDRSKVVGQAGLLLTSPPSYRFNLEVDQFDLDRYLPASAEAHSVQGGAAANAPNAPAVDASMPSGTLDHKTVATPKPAPSAPLFPLQRTRSMDLDGHLRADELRVAKLTLGDAALQIDAKQGRIRIKDQVGSFYQGEVTGHIELDARQDPPRVALVQQASGIQTGPLLLDLTGEDTLDGRGSFSTDLNAAGRSIAALKQSLGGTVAVHFAEGVVKGVNLEHMIRETEARLKGRPAPAKEPLKTEFTELQASATIHAGVLSNRDLRTTSNYLQITGKGQVDIANERFDYRFAPRFVDPPEGRGIKEIEDIPVPVRLSGSFDDPRWNIDLGPVLREVAKRRLESELDAEDGGRLRELEERTGIKGLEQGLRRFFGR